METPPPTPPTPAPESAAPAASAVVLSTPTPVAVGTSRSSQFALGVVLAIALGLLAYRGYGNGFGTRPTELASAPVTDLNQADRAQLEQVPGIGPTLAKAIEDHRAKKGPFRSVEELRQVKGVGPVTLDKVRPFLRVEPTNLPTTDSISDEPLVLERKPTTPSAAPPPRANSGTKKLQPGDPPIDVNTAGLDELIRLPGIGPSIAQNIIAARADRPFRTLADLDKVKGIGPKKLEQIKPFVMVK
jgi:competence protein ComEA